MITVNGREMNFIIDGNKYRLPTLTSISKTGKEKRYEMYTIDNNIYTEHYYHPDGKHTVSEPTTAYGKNIGKKNETTNHEQALFVSYSKWLKKQDMGYAIVGDTTVQTVLPMLANKYSDRGKKYLTEPFGVSRKLDGIRALAQVVDGKVIMYSRTGKVFENLLMIKDSILKVWKQDFYPQNIIIDGEIYSHDIPFNKISGAVRAKKTSDIDHLLEFWIFDVICDRPYLERVKIMDRLSRYAFKCTEAWKHLQFVLYEESTHDEVQKYHDKFVAEGYEGLICRQLDSKYEIGHRSNHLLKYKQFTDEEFEIIGYTTGVGGEKGAIIFKCITGEYEFDIRPRGTIENRRKMFEAGDSFIGKQLTIRFQEKDSITGIPRFPVGISVRDYE